MRARVAAEAAEEAKDAAKMKLKEAKAEAQRIQFALNKLESDIAQTTTENQRTTEEDVKQNTEMLIETVLEAYFVNGKEVSETDPVCQAIHLLKMSMAQAEKEEVEEIDEEDEESPASLDSSAHTRTGDIFVRPTAKSKARDAGPTTPAGSSAEKRTTTAGSMMAVLQGVQAEAGVRGLTNKKLCRRPTK